MRKARHRAKLSVAGRFSKKPGLVTTIGKTKFIRSLIRNRASCNDGCRLNIVGTFVGTWSSASPLEIPLIFSKPITVDWDDDVNPLIEVIQPGERVVHHYSSTTPPSATDATPRLGTIAAAGGTVNPRNIRISFSASDIVTLDYDANGGYFLKHLNDAQNNLSAHTNKANAKLVPVMSQTHITNMKGAIDTITSWGGDDTKPKIFLKSLEGATNLTNITANDTPRFGLSLKNAFKGNANLQRITSMNEWKTGSVRDMEGLFEGAAKFLGARAGENFNLDTGSALTMKSMFKGAAQFNTDLGNKFKTDFVETMESMFEGATNFNKAINFNTPNLGNGVNANKTAGANNMFKNATAFNQDVSSLDFRNLTSVTDPFANAAMRLDTTKQPVAGEKKAVVKDGIVLVGKNTPFYFKGVSGGGSFAVGYVDKFYHQLDAANKAFHNMTGGVANPTVYASVNLPGTVANDEYQMVNYENNRILAIEVRYTNTTDTPVSQPALDDANVYIYFSKPVTLNTVVLSEAGGTNSTTHTAGNNSLHKISVASGAKDNATTPAAFPDVEKNLVTKGIGGLKPHSGNLTVYRLTGVNNQFFGDGANEAYPGLTNTKGIKVKFN